MSLGRGSSLGGDYEPAASPPHPATLDTFIGKLGNPGRYQIVVMLLLSTNYIPVVINHILMVFYTSGAPHNCKIPSEGEKSLYLPPSENVAGELDSCSMYIDPSNHTLGTTVCKDGYEFHFPGESEWTMTAEWELVCDRDFLAPLIITIYFLGVMIGGVIFGGLSDKFGRKIIMLICLYTQCVLGIGFHFVKDLLVFIGLRFIQGIFIQGLQCVTYSMVMELFPASWRTMAGCIVEAFWAGGIVLLAVIAKYVQHWRYIQLAINIPTIATLFYIWIIPESLRWLISKGEVNKAEQVVSSIIGYNSLKLDINSLRTEIETISKVFNDKKGNNRSPDITDILRVPTIRVRSLVLFFIWFSVSLCYYGVTYYIPNLYGDKYLNFIMSGGIELASYLLAFVVLGGFGRQGPLCGYLALSGVICVAVVSVQTFVPPSWMDVSALVTGLTLVGRASIVSCFCTIFIYSSELFPTVIRTVGVGTCTLLARAGSLLAPQVLLLGEYIYADKKELVPFLTFGTLCLLASLLACILPETMNTDLPDTIEDAARQGMKRDSESNESLDVGYGKCPEFVCVDGLIVSRENNSWREDGEGGHTDTEQSLVSTQGTLTTLRSRTSSKTENDYEVIPESKSTPVKSLADARLGHPAGSIKSSPLSRPMGGRNRRSSGSPSSSLVRHQRRPDSLSEEPLNLGSILRSNDDLLSDHIARLNLSRNSVSLGQAYGGDTTTAGQTDRSDYLDSTDTQDTDIYISGDCSVQSGEQSLASTSTGHPPNQGVGRAGGANQTKDNLVKEILKQKLLNLDNNETRL